jgi:hypothetical protein
MISYNLDCQIQTKRKRKNLERKYLYEKNPMITIDKIRRLKQQAKHGSVWDEVVRAGSDVAAIFTSTTDLASNATTAYTGLIGAIGSLNTVNNTLVAGFEKQTAVNQKLISTFVDAAKKTLFLELRNKKLNDSFGINVIGAARVSQQLQTLSTKYMWAGKNTQEYAAAVKKILPTLNQSNVQNQEYYEGLMVTQRVLTTNLGLSEDQAASYTHLATQNGKNAANMLSTTKQLANFLDTDGTMGYFKMITEGLAETAADVQMQYGKLPNNLALGVLRAKTLGLTMEQMASAGESLLDIESSIGSELEYQLLSGKRLVDEQGKSLTNTYREATLQGDAAEQANTLFKILEQEGEVLENNLFARQQMSQLLGMDEASLARAMQKKKMLEQAGPEAIKLFDLTGDELKTTAEAMLESGAITQDIFDSLQADTRTSETILEEILTAITEDNALLRTGQEGVVRQTQIEMMGPGGSLEKMDGSLIQMSDSLLQTTGQIVLAGENLKTMTTSYVRDLFINSGTHTSETTAAAKDAIIMNDGIVKFHPQDKFMQVNDSTMIAGTNVDGNRQLARAITGTGNNNNDMVKFAMLIVNAINQQTAALRGNLFQERGINTPLY